MSVEQQDQYLRWECINFECAMNPKGYYLVSVENADECDDRPNCTHCGAPMIREDEMAKNVLLWEMGIETELDGDDET